MKFPSRLPAVPARFRSLPAATWRRWRGLSPWGRFAIGVALVLLLVALIWLVRRSAPVEEAIADAPSVTLASVAELSGTAAGLDLIATVRSREEAVVLAKSGGTVVRANATLGGTVAAGSVILELENDAERAAVAQAEAGVAGAVAGRSVARYQAGGISARAEGADDSTENLEADARDAYFTTFTALDTTLENDIDAFFGVPTPVGPDLLLNEDTDSAYAIQRERDRIGALVDAYEENLARAGDRSAYTLLDEAQLVTRELQAFANRIAGVANQRGSGATPAQITALASARTSLNALVSQLAGVRTALNAAEANERASGFDERAGEAGIEGAEAQVQAAQASLRAAQVALDRTVVRAPIGGQVNSFDVGVGDYIAPNQEVAVIAQNGALEIVAFVTEDQVERIVPGSTVAIEGGFEGVVTQIAPAVDPDTRRVEVRIAVESGTGLLNGGTVRVTFPDTVADAAGGPALLPLASVKLAADGRSVFSVDADGRLIAHPVEVGEVRGDRIEVLTDLDAGLRIVADARGLAEGELVTVGEGDGI